MNATSLVSQATAFALAAAVTLSMLVGVNSLATSEHAANGSQLLARTAQSATRG